MWLVVVWLRVEVSSIERSIVLPGGTSARLGLRVHLQEKRSRVMLGYFYSRSGFFGARVVRFLGLYMLFFFCWQMDKFGRVWILERE